MGLIRLAFSLAFACFCMQTGHDAGASEDIPAISIIAPEQLLASPIAKSAIDDSLCLLREAFPGGRVSLNDRSAEVLIVLARVAPSVEKLPRIARGQTPGYLAYPDHDYEWRSRRKNGRINVTLRAPSLQGVSFALYGLLQEKLGFRFYHPRKTLIPCHRRWPLPVNFRFSARPRFDKKGFHLHTLHPMELAEQLNDPAYPNALPEVKEYMDWLVRNGQNVVQFFILRDIDRQGWIGHAKAICEYAHRRGIMIGVQISVAMLQQQAFQVVKLFRPYPSYREQVDRNLAWLFQAGWDFVTVEPTMGEYLPDLGRLTPDITTYLLGEINGRYRAKAMLATHVIRAADERGKCFSVPDAALDPAIGMLIHTVMCYSLTDPKAPVYGNENQCFMLERARRETRRREVWYWPESSYWVAFDTPVPLFLLPYLDARWRDMDTVEGIGVANHLTFSTGWEWGYWLMDWSIARWSWRYSENGRVAVSGPLDSLLLLFPGKNMAHLWRRALDLQNRYLKERELLKYMAALTPFSELPRPLRFPFQPEPDFTYSWLLRRASNVDVARVLNGPVAGLDRYAREMEEVAAELDGESSRLFAGKRGERAERRVLAGELVRGLRVTALRARHRSLTLRALMAKRSERPAGIGNPEDLLSAAAAIRGRALGLVRLQEEIYRYPVKLIARKRRSLTAYPFGYLYPVSNLFFWQREEEQVRLERFDPFFMNIWDFNRTLGLSSLFF